MPKAAIVDLNGTMRDSVDLHALAWHEAMTKFGHDVSFEQARGQIGKGGDKLLPAFLSADQQRDHGKAMEEWRSERARCWRPCLIRRLPTRPVEPCGRASPPSLVVCSLLYILPEQFLRLCDIPRRGELGL